jgi:hypothetical protein
LAASFSTDHDPADREASVFAEESDMLVEGGHQQERHTNIVLEELAGDARGTTALADVTEVKGFGFGEEDDLLLLPDYRQQQMRRPRAVLEKLAKTRGKIREVLRSLGLYGTVRSN